MELMGLNKDKGFASHTGQSHTFFCVGSGSCSYFLVLVFAVTWYSENKWKETLTFESGDLGLNPSTATHLSCDPSRLCLLPDEKDTPEGRCEDHMG